MWEHIITWCLLGTTLIALVFFVKRALPELIQSVLDDVAGQLNEVFANPTIKKAYSILGSQSGQSRADAALRNRVADKVLDGMPIIKKICEYFEIEPIEGLQLMNDPLISPIIQGFVQKGIDSNIFAGLPQGLNKSSSSDFGDQRLVSR